MPYTFEQFRQQARKDFVESLSEQEMKDIARKLPPKDRLEGVPTKDRLEGVPTKDRVEGLAAEERLEGMAPEEVLKVISKALSQEEIENLLRKSKEESGKSN